MKTVVITGSTRGIGYHLADNFLQRGCKVVVSSRSQGAVDKALASLSEKHAKDHLLGVPCDVAQLDQVQALWDAAKEHFGQIDIWINNAGIGHPMMPVWELSPEQTRQVVDIDLVGMMYGSRVAVKGMLEQGQGFLYNMEGFGSDGRIRAGLTVYGSTKAALRYFTKGLVKETEDTSVKVGYLSPGIVITDFIFDQYKDHPEDLERAKRIFNILGDLPETVTSFLVDEMLKNQKSGSSIAWLTGGKIAWRFLTARFNKRNLFAQSEATA